MEKINITTGLLGFMVLVCTYLAQSWARKCYLELKALNEKLAGNGKSNPKQ